MDESAVRLLEPEWPDDDLSADTSRLDGSLLRYVLLHRSRLNMLDLDRAIRSMIDGYGVVSLAPGATRSEMRFRAEATMQLAVELALARPAVIAWIHGDALRRQWAIDAAYYASACWQSKEAKLKDVFGGVTATTPATVDAGFWTYLINRTRLTEEHKGDNATESASLSAAAKAVEALDLRDLREASERLQRIALDVLELLSTHANVGHWRRLAEDGRLAGAMKRPPPEVFDALLLGADALVSGVGERAAWTVDAEGQRRQRPADDRLMDSGELRDIRSHVDEAETALARLLSLDTVVPPFSLLSDRLSLLPTTPAWPDVQRALSSLALADTEQQQRELSRGATVAAAGAPALPAQLSADLHAEAQVLRLFDDILTNNAGLLTRALCAGAFLGALGDGNAAEQAKLHKVSMRRLGLERLAEGLQFRSTNGGGIEAKLTVLHAEWHGLARRSGLAQRNAWPQADASEPLPTWEEGAAQSETAAEDARWKLGSVIDEAWSAARTRLVRFSKDGRIGDASLVELICAVRHEGPAQWVRLNPARMNLGEWARALFAALRFPEVPTWLGVIALQRLGANTLGPAEQDRLLGLLMNIEKRDSRVATAWPPEGRSLVNQCARIEGAWKPGSRSAGTALLLLRADGSRLTEAWRHPPNRGLVLPAIGDDVRSLLWGAPDLFAALPGPMSTWREEAAIDARDFHHLRRRVDDAVHRRLVARLQRRLALALSLSADAGGVVASSTGPDELFGAPESDDGGV